MSSVEFQEDNFTTFERHEPEAGGLIGLLIKMGLAGNKQTAQVILMGVFVIAVGATGMLLFTGGGGEVKLPPPPPVYQGGVY